MYARIYIPVHVYLLCTPMYTCVSTYIIVCAYMHVCCTCSCRDTNWGVWGILGFQWPHLWWSPALPQGLSLIAAIGFIHVYQLHPASFQAVVRSCQAKPENRSSSWCFMNVSRTTSTKFRWITRAGHILQYGISLLYEVHHLRYIESFDLWMDNMRIYECSVVNMYACINRAYILDRTNHKCMQDSLGLRGSSNQKDGSFSATILGSRIYCWIFLHEKKNNHSNCLKACFRVISWSIYNGFYSNYNQYYRKKMCWIFV